MALFDKELGGPSALILTQFEAVKENAVELDAQLEEMQRLLNAPKPDLAKIKELLSGALVLSSLVTTQCP